MRFKDTSFRNQARALAGTMNSKKTTAALPVKTASSLDAISPGAEYAAGVDSVLSAEGDLDWFAEE